MRHSFSSILLPYLLLSAHVTPLMIAASHCCAPLPPLPHVRHRTYVPYSRSCHADDREHRYVTCTKPCNRLHKPCGHACERTCGEPCGRCTQRVNEPYQLECGHAGPQGVQCWK